ncbi:TPA: hypothetical protein MAL34_000974 [Klebsiella pneumoniae]|nr:hypothetical protein [Klebsiella pneumoniae]
MTKSTITRERAQQIFLGNGPEPSASEERELARMALAAMDSEPHTDDELSNLLWYSQEATCHSDPNYYCEFQRLATPGFIAWIIRELQERRKADSEPVKNHIGSKNSLDAIVSFIKSKGNPTVKCYEEVSEQLFKDNCHGIHSHVIEYILKLGEELKDLRAEQAEMQPAPVVPDDVLAALQKVARIRLDMNDFDGDRRGIADCLGDAEEALIEVVNRRAAMLAAATQPQNAPQNIPEIIPNELIAAVNRLLDSNGSRGCYNAIKCYDAHIEVERLLAAARQEVKP